LIFLLVLAKISDHRNKMKITISDEFRAVLPVFEGCAVTAEVKNSEFNAELWNEITSFSEHCRQVYTEDSVKDFTPINATRDAYRKFGKQPSRYRPAAEALIRRVVKGGELYKINTLADLVNLASMVSGYSIGGFDLSKIQGDLTLGIGRAGEPYEGIGRGILNIEHLPVYRDNIGGVGTPTSDNERTKISVETTHFLLLVNGYDGNADGVLKCANHTVELIKKYCSAENIVVTPYN
jgi:DNA/RNA-binding domain of Phe-tRNA-synthetase-like protein